LPNNIEADSLLLFSNTADRIGPTDSWPFPCDLAYFRHFFPQLPERCEYTDMASILQGAFPTKEEDPFLYFSGIEFLEDPKDRLIERLCHVTHPEFVQLVPGFGISH
jgi:hypothetical protein